MSAIANLQRQEDSPSTLLLRFGSLHRSTVSVEEASEEFYRSQFLGENSQPSHQEIYGTNLAGLASLPQLADTRPLVIKKALKPAPKIMPTSLARERRPSAHHPRSPISPHLSRARASPSSSTSSPRASPQSRSRAASIATIQPLSAISLTPLTNLGLNFLTMNASDPNSSAPILLAHHQGNGASPKIYAVDRSSLASLRKASLTDSELHLNLGQWSLWDEAVQPGHSPSGTPASSPLKKNFGASSRSGRRVVARRKSSTTMKPRVAPREPMTPSRAPSKAIQFLGTGSEAKKSVSSSKRQANAKPSKKRDNFRPLPSSVNKEIDAFFGTTSKKPTPNLRTSKPLPATPGTMNRNVGKGATVEVKGEDGQVWADAEEAAEFAWLLSECGRGDIVLPLSPVLGTGRRSVSSAESSPSHSLIPEDVDEGENDDIRIGRASDSDGTGFSDTDEDPFGMTNFRSVYNVPKPHKAPFIIGAKAAQTLGIYGDNNGGKTLPFLSFDPYASPSKKSSASKHRPPPLTLRSASARGPNVVAVQHDFLESSFSPSSSKAKARMDATTIPRSTSSLHRGKPSSDRVEPTARSASDSKYIAPRTAPSPPQQQNRSRASSHSIFGVLNSSPPRQSDEEIQRQAWVDSQAKGESFFETSPVHSTFKSRMKKLRKALK